MAEERQQGEYARLLSQSFLFQGAGTEAAQKLLESDWHLLPFAKGELIFAAGVNEGCLGLITSGRAIAYSGASAVLRSFAKGDIFGAAALFATGAEPVSRIVAASGGELLLLPLASVRALLRSEPKVAENYIRFLSQRVAFLNHKIADFTAGEAKKRLAAYIAAHCHADELERPVFNGNISRLAQTLNISRASLYRALNQLEEQSLLHREGKSIVVDNLKQLY